MRRTAARLLVVLAGIAAVLAGNILYVSGHGPDAAALADGRALIAGNTYFELASSAGWASR